MFSGNFRKCFTTADCEVHNSSSSGIQEDVHCADHAGRGYKTCFCVSILKETDKDGSCETRMAHFSYFIFYCFCFFSYYLLFRTLLRFNENQFKIARNHNSKFIMLAPASEGKECIYYVFFH